MGLLTTCPSCGLKSDEIRCPRCNTLKVKGCDGQCAACRAVGGGSDACGVSDCTPVPAPSEDAASR